MEEVEKEEEEEGEEEEEKGVKRPGKNKFINSSQGMLNVA